MQANVFSDLSGSVEKMSKRCVMVSCVPGAGLYVKSLAGRGLCFEIVRILSSLSSGLVFGIIPPNDPREGTSLGRESFNHQSS